MLFRCSKGNFKTLTRGRPHSPWHHRCVITLSLYECHTLTNWTTLSCLSHIGFSANKLEFTSTNKHWYIWFKYLRPINSKYWPLCLDINKSITNLPCSFITAIWKQYFKNKTTDTSLHRLSTYFIKFILFRLNYLCQINTLKENQSK